MLTVEKDNGTFILIVIPNTKTNIRREFTISSGNFEGVNLLQIFRKYSALRPSDFESTKFFCSYRNGRCMKQHVGINTIGSVPTKIAQFLNLQNPASYTGHCFRRTSATLLADAGGDIVSLKRHGGWKSTSVAEGYLEDSIQNKLQVASKILGQTEIKNVNTTCTLVKNDENVINVNTSASTQKSAGGGV